MKEEEGEVNNSVKDKKKKRHFQRANTDMVDTSSLLQATPKTHEVNKC